MKVLILNGSPRKKGNTALALSEMEKVFHENGIETEIVHIGNMDIRGCMACGSCTAVCTAGKYAATSLREAIESIHNGQPDKALSMLRSCQFCGKCTMVCPRGINTRHLILSINKTYGKI